MSLDGSAHLLELLGIQWPIIQAPMAGVGTPALAAAVSNADGLGSLGVGGTDAEGARKMIAAFRVLSARPLNVNVFCHQPAKLDPRVESAWIERLRPAFARFGATPPTRLPVRGQAKSRKLWRAFRNYWTWRFRPRKSESASYAEIARRI